MEQSTVYGWNIRNGTGVSTRADGSLAWFHMSNAAPQRRAGPAGARQVDTEAVAGRFGAAGDPTADLCVSGPTEGSVARILRVTRLYPASFEREVGMAGKFVLFTDSAGKFRWRLKAGTGEIIAASQAYESKDAAEKGIASVRSQAPSAEVIDDSMKV
ncbi:YegP family protein [Nocardia sp. NPDC001965]